MNYLISAYSVNPYNGSEDGVGWNWVLQYERNFKVGDSIVLLTKSVNENAIRKGFIEYDIKHVQLVIVDVPKYLNWYREKHSMFHHMYYMLWQHWAWLWVEHSGIKFDLIHHVTMGDYRILGEMYKCKSAYKIFGPVGGAQITPIALRGYEGNKFAATFREFINWSVGRNPLYANKLKKFDRVIASNNETYKQLCRIKNDGLMQEVELGISKESQWKDLSCKKESKTVRLLFVGRLIHKKGIRFLMDIIERLPRENTYVLDIYGDGPCGNILREWIEKNQLKEIVFLRGNKPHDEVIKSYENADIFLFTSLRETGGTVLLEAMSNALPIIAFNTSFCTTLMQRKCGIFINTNQELQDIKKDFSNAIMDLINNEEYRRELGLNGYNYVNEELTWEKKYKRVYNNYE